MISEKVQQNIEYWKGRRMLVHNTLYRVKIESSLGCNRDCKFCGMTRKTTCLMSMETYNTILSKLPNTIKRVEFILHGEPTLNKNLLTFFRKLKEKLPKCQIAISTNGWRFLQKSIDFDYFIELFEAGANIVQLSLYDKECFDIFRDMVHSNSEKIIKENIKLKDLYNTHENLFEFKGSKNRQVIYVTEYEGLNSGGSMQRRFHTFGGNIPVEIWPTYSKKYPDFEKFPLTGKGKTCTSLLKYLSIGANGDIYLCCRDASHSIILGNINTTDLETLWYSKEVQILRRVMKATRRDLIAPCFLCSRFCYRDPLYPYWGEDYYEKECIETIHNMTVLQNDVLLQNLIKYQELYPEKLPNHIVQEIKEARNKYKI